MKKPITCLALCSFVQIAFAQINLNLGLVANYSFTGNANDASGNNNHGIVYGATLTAGQTGIPNTAYHFNGTSDYIEVANSPSLSPTLLTLCAVVKPEGFYSGKAQGNVILWKGSPESSTGHYALLFSDAPYDTSNLNSLDTLHETFYGEAGTNNNWSSSQLYYTPTITTNTWYCLIFTFDGSVMNFYVNGNLKYTVPATTPLGSNSSPIGIGRISPYNVSYPFWFHGIMDDLRIYNRVLNSAEIGSYCGLINSVNETGQTNELVELSTISSNGIFNLHVLKSMQDIHISVYNSMGQLIQTETSYNLNAGSKKMLNVSAHAKGIYYIEVIAEGKLIRKKIISQ